MSPRARCSASRARPVCLTVWHDNAGWQGGVSHGHAARADRAAADAVGLSASFGPRAPEAGPPCGDRFRWSPITVQALATRAVLSVTSEW